MSHTMSDMHISRQWSGNEQNIRGCNCTVLECGFVSMHEANVNHCPQHDWEAARTMRRMHPENVCADRDERAWI